VDFLDGEFVGGRRRAAAGAFAGGAQFVGGSAGEGFRADRRGQVVGLTELGARVAAAAFAA
jgi:hypothetical protein